MKKIRINVSLPQEIVTALSQRLPARKRSQFIAEAIKWQLQDQNERQPAADYQDAAEEGRKINQELEGTLNDGIY